MSDFTEIKAVLNQYLNDTSIDPETKVRIVKRLLNNKCEKCGYNDIIDGIDRKFFLLEKHSRVCYKCFIR